MSYTLSWEKSGVYWNYTGDVSGEEILEASIQVYGHSRFEEIEYKLVNFTGTTSVNITKDQVELIAYQHHAAIQINPKILNVIVVEPDCDLAEEFAQFFKHSNWQVEIVNSINEANSLLNR